MSLKVILNVCDKIVYYTSYNLEHAWITVSTFLTYIDIVHIAENFGFDDI